MSEPVNHYDELHDVYMKHSEKFLQTFEPENFNDFLSWVMKKANIKNFQSGISFGSGLGYLENAIQVCTGSRIRCYNSSKKQVAFCKDNFKNLDVIEGDMNAFDPHFVTMDFALLIESIGYVKYLDSFFEKLHGCMIPGGRVLIKHAKASLRMDDSYILTEAEGWFGYEFFSAPEIATAAKKAGFAWIEESDFAYPIKVRGQKFLDDIGEERLFKNYKKFNEKITLTPNYLVFERT